MNPGVSSLRRALTAPFWSPVSRETWIEFYRAAIRGLDGDIRDTQHHPISNDSALILTDLRSLKTEIEGRLAAVEEGTGDELGWV